MLRINLIQNAATNVALFYFNFFYLCNIYQVTAGQQCSKCTNGGTFVFFLIQLLRLCSSFHRTITNLLQQCSESNVETWIRQDFWITTVRIYRGD